jgi:hypothetical protein
VYISARRWGAQVEEEDQEGDSRPDQQQHLERAECAANIQSTIGRPGRGRDVGPRKPRQNCEGGQIEPKEDQGVPRI